MKTVKIEQRFKRWVNIVYSFQINQHKIKFVIKEKLFLAKNKFQVPVGTNLLLLSKFVSTD